MSTVVHLHEYGRKIRFYRVPLQIFNFHEECNNVQDTEKVINFVKGGWDFYLDSSNVYLLRGPYFHRRERIFA